MSEAAAISLAAISALRSPSDSFGALNNFTNEITLPQQEPSRGELRPGVIVHDALDYRRSVRRLTTLRACRASWLKSATTASPPTNRTSSGRSVKAGPQTMTPIFGFADSRRIVRMFEAR